MHRSIKRHTSSAGPTRRIINRASADGARTLSATPPARLPMLTVVSPSSGSLGSSSVSSSARSFTSSRVAERPRCGYAECAAWPVTRTTARMAPFVPTASVLSVGSPLMSIRESDGASPNSVRANSLAACAPSCAVSSPTTKSRPTATSRSRSRSAAQIIAAAIPFASQAPRPSSESPSTRGGMNGGTVYK